MTEYEKHLLEWALNIKAMGFRVFMAASKEYGYITDKDGTRVLSFSGGVNGGLWGAYQPNRKYGLDWKMKTKPTDLKTKKDVNTALYAHPPSWISEYKLSTEAQYRDTYQSTSFFTKL